jgi:acetolactate synthase-1/2/3 large subunit
MKKTGAWLAVHAMEQIGLTHTFGIPGVHNTEIYDELNKSNAITPVLVTHEGGGAFMADGVSRAGEGVVGALMIVPAAGFTHAASGIGEAFLDGVAMLVFSGGVRTDTGRAYQLHDIDQMTLAAPLTKAAFRIAAHRDVIPTIHEAYRIATPAFPARCWWKFRSISSCSPARWTSCPPSPPRRRRPRPTRRRSRASPTACSRRNDPACSSGGARGRRRRS